VQLHLLELIAEISTLLGYKKITGTVRGQFVKLQTAVRAEPKMSVMKLSR
jgi:hypothetical protein